MRLFVFRPGIHLPAEIARFRRYGWYFFQYETRRLSVEVGRVWLELPSPIILLNQIQAVLGNPIQLGL